MTSKPLGKQKKTLQKSIGINENKGVQQLRNNIQPHYSL